MRVGELVADEHAVGHVLVGGYDMLVAGDSWEGTGRDAAVGELVTLVVSSLLSCFGDELPSVDDRMHVEQFRVDGRSLVGYQQVGDDDCRQLVLVGEVEHLGNRLEGVERIAWCEDEFREVALTGAEHLPQVALLGLRGHPGGRAGTLHVDDDDGHLHHSGCTYSFGHQRESTT